MRFNPQDSLGFQCALTFKLFTRALAQQLKGSGISPAQFIALAHLVDTGPMRQAELAECLSIAPPSAVRLIDRMQRDGWVMRTADPDDRRVWQVVPTDIAAVAWKKLSTHAQAIVNEAYRGIDPEKIALTRQVLEQMRANLDNQEAGISKNAGRSGAATKKILDGTNKAI